MICAQPQPEGGWQFILRPNRSLSRRGARGFFLGMAAVSLTIALGLGFLGFWWILPFAGAELALLAICLWQVRRRLSYQEVLTLEQDSLTVEYGRHCAECRQVLPRHWVRVVPRPQGLGLRSHGRLLAIATCLPQDEQAMLARWLQAALHNELAVQPHCMVTQVLSEYVIEVE